MAIAPPAVADLFSEMFSAVTEGEDPEFSRHNQVFITSRHRADAIA